MTPSHDTLIQEHAPLVRRLAMRMVSKLPSSVELDDLIQSGMIGLLDAIRRFKTVPGAQFTTYATTRINGAMLDELRRQDWLPRTMRKSARKIELAIQQLEHELGRSAAEGEIAERMNMPVDEYYSLLDDAQGVQLIHLDEMLDNDGEDSTLQMLDAMCSTSPSPLDDILHEEFKRSVVAAIDRLPERERLLLSLYFVEDLNNMEVAEVLSITPGRATQLRTQAIARVRATLALTAQEVKKYAELSGCAA